MEFLPHKTPVIISHSANNWRNRTFLTLLTASIYCNDENMQLQHVAMRWGWFKGSCKRNQLRLMAETKAPTIASWARFVILLWYLEKKCQVLIICTNTRFYISHHVTNTEKYYVTRLFNWTWIHLSSSSHVVFTFCIFMF